MNRVFVVTLPRPMAIAGTRGGHRTEFAYTALDTADALRRYYQEFPDGIEPENIEDRNVVS